MTLKTPLPSKIGQNEFINERTTRIELVNTLDQLIDHVKELGEGVEGKHAETCPYSKGAYFLDCDCGHFKTSTPSLKETLIAEIYKEYKFRVSRDEMFDVVHVEAIINQLLP